MTESDLLNVNLARLNAAIARASIRALGMQAENAQCAHRGEAMVYGKRHFWDLIASEGLDHNSVIVATRP